MYAGWSDPVVSAIDTTKYYEAVAKTNPNAADFSRFTGRSAKVKLGKPAPDGQRLLRGSISALSGPEGAERLEQQRRDLRVEVEPREDPVERLDGARPEGGARRVLAHTYLKAKRYDEARQQLEIAIELLELAPAAQQHAADDPDARRRSVRPR